MEGLIKSMRAIFEKFFVTTRRSFAGIIVFISSNRNEVVAKKIHEAQQTHLISPSLTKHGRKRPGRTAT